MPQITQKHIEEKICKMYEDGYNGVQLQKIFQLNMKTIYKILHRNKTNVKNASQAHKKFNFNEHYFDVIDTHRKAYWLGFLAGDGSVNDKNQIVINLSNKDDIILHQFKKDIDAEYNIKYYTYKISTCSLILISKHMKETLAKYNIIPNKTKSLELSENIPKEFINSFILGFSDADGCFSVDKSRGIRYLLIGNSKMINQVQNVLIQNCNINKNKLMQHQETNYIQTVVYSGNLQVKRICDFLYKDCDFYLPRKKKIVDDYFSENNLSLLKINRIKNDPLNKFKK